MVNWLLIHSAISRDSDLANFFNEFYPAYDGGIIIGRLIRLGVVWNTATTLAEITYLMRGRITDYSINQRDIQFTVLQESNLD